MMKSARWVVQILLTVLVSFLLVACAKGTPAAAPAAGKDLRLVVRRYPKAGLPYYARTDADQLAAWLQYDTFLMQNLQDTTTELQPHLAESWQLSDDGLSLTFRIDPRATFQNGEPVLATDAAFGFTLLRGGTMVSLVSEKVTCIDTMTVSGERELTFTLRKDCPNALVDLGTAVSVFNESANANKGGLGGTDVQERRLSGSGPFAIDKKTTVEGERLVLRSTGNHHRLKPIVDTVTFTVVQDESVPVSSTKIADVALQIFGTPD